MTGDTLTFKAGDTVLNMSYTANTYLIYKRFFDSDLMSDIVKVGASGKSIPKDVSDKIESGEITLDNMDELDLSSIGDAKIDSTIMVQIVIAMIATYERSHNKRRSVDEIADGIPAKILVDADFISQFTDFMTFGVKKKTE